MRDRDAIGARDVVVPGRPTADPVVRATARIGALGDIVTTQGNDIGNLMFAMRKLKSVYTLQAVLLGLACLLVIVVLFLVIGGHS